MIQAEICLVSKIFKTQWRSRNTTLFLYMCLTWHNTVQYMSQHLAPWFVVIGHGYRLHIKIREVLHTYVINTMYSSIKQCSLNQFVQFPHQTVN